ncbi:KTSC domain-containing protein [Niallia taxi]|uniref:KTSC domain-containing protein n=1 Tax=Niallia taxi TaxID=2499688 RepID=UPI0015F58940|nr:KTSC domain-containing protein [Niallia taxi]
MIMQPVASSNLISVGYDDTANTLYIQFHNGTYKYYNVPYIVYRSLMDAPSKGEYHSAFIKNRYQYSRA